VIDKALRKYLLPNGERRVKIANDASGCHAFRYAGEGENQTSANPLVPDTPT
jgi:hypothetical protein